MAYQATVIPVMIASPGDVYEFRSLVRDVLHEWNYINSVSLNVVLMPVGWETHASPELGAKPQELINDRILEECDLLIGIFWTRLGTPTLAAASGTVEEIQRHIESGKPAMVYFSSAPVVLDTVDPDQYAALKEFREWCKSQGLIESFDHGQDLQMKLSKHLQITMLKNPHLKSLVEQSTGGVGSPIITGSPTNSPKRLAGVLTEEARQLLKEAAKGRGFILKHVTLDGRFIKTENKTFGGGDDHRDSMRWEYALDQLISAGLVVGRENKGVLFEVTEPGYQLADFLS